MIHSEKMPMDFNMLMKSVWQKKWLVLIFIAGVLIPIIVFNQKSRPVYEARTAFIYEHSNDAINTAKRSRPLDKSIIINAIEEIKSLSLAENVFDALPDDVIESFALPRKKPANFDKKSYLSKHIQKSISVANIVSSDVIVVKTKANTPETAMALAQTVTRILKERSLKSRHKTISNVRKLIEDQLKNYEDRLKFAEEALRNYKEKGEITYIDEESREILKRVTEAEVLYNKAKANLDASVKRLKFLQTRLLKERRDLLPSITEITSPMIRHLKNDLIDLEIEYTKVKVQNYEENHPAMLELKSQINLTKQKLIAETLKITKGGKIIDPLSQIQKLMEEIISIEIAVQSHRAQEATLEQIINNYKTELSTMPEKELRLARLIRDKEVNNKIYTMLMEKREEARIREAEKFGNIRVFDPPRMPDKPIWPKKLLNMALGLFLGCILGLGWIAIQEYVDNRLKSIEQIGEVSKLDVIGTIPKMKKAVNAPSKSEQLRFESSTDKAMNAKLITYYGPRSVEIEVFRTLRTNLQFAGFGKTKKAILLTSCNPDEGKSLITANLGISCANIGLKTLLIDGDLRKPSQHSIFDIKRKPGLSNLIFSKQLLMNSHTENADIHLTSQEEMVLNRQTEYDEQFEDSDFIYDYIKKENIIHRTQTSGLDLLPSGAIPPNPADILTLPILRNIISLFKERYDVILIDSPPINVVIDASLLSSVADGILLVAKAGVNTKMGILKAKEALLKNEANIIGIVANFVEGDFQYSNYYSKNGKL